MKIGSLFSGYGGLDIAVENHFGAETVWHAEFEEAPSKVLAAHWPGVPNHHDVSVVDWASVEPVDIITGGFPCQDVSMAGKRAGMTEGTRSNLWGAMRTAIEAIRPQYAVIENVRGLLSATAQSDSDLEQRPGFMGNEPNVTLRALGRVLGDLADIGYNAQWHGLFAADIGAPHWRYRVFILATDASSKRPQRQERWSERRHIRKRPELGSGRSQTFTNSHSASSQTPLRRQRARHLGRQQPVVHSGANIAWGESEPAIRRWERILGRVVPGPTELSPTGRHRLSPIFVEWMMGLPQGHVAAIDGITWADQIKMLGNGVVPQQALAALRVMTERMRHAEAA